MENMVTLVYVWYTTSGLGHPYFKVSRFGPNDWKEALMKKRFSRSIVVFTLATLLALLSGFGEDSVAASGAAKAAVRTTEYGQIEGMVDGKTLAWLGVPFAKPPVGNLRWQPPQAPEPWTGVKPAKEYCDACAQVGGMFGPTEKGKPFNTLSQNFFRPVGSEDCLYLNIWRPATAEMKLPVVVFIHGGTNVVGATSDPAYIGANLARNANLIVITVAYRLGHLGWFSHPALKTGDPIADSGNYALLDLIQSLKFIKNNIANFGGDPDNVTIMGQSAGASNVYGLIASPLAAGFFHKAIPLSGRAGGATPAAAVAKADGLINALLIKDGLATDKDSADKYRTAQGNDWIKNYLMSKTAADLMNIQVDPKGGKFGTGAYNMEPGSTTASLWNAAPNIQDGAVLPADFWAAIAAGKFNKVPQLVGSTAEEGKLFAAPAFKIDNFTRFGWMVNSDPNKPGTFKLEQIINDKVISPLTPENYDQYTYDNRNKVTPGPSITTATFLTSITKSNNAFYPQVPLYAYDFRWAQQPAPWDTVYGAWHTGDLPFIFGNFNKNLSCFGWSKANEPGRKALSNAMQKSIGAFARTGDPSNNSLGTKWEPWAPDMVEKMVFDANYKKSKTYMAVY